MRHVLPLLLLGCAGSPPAPPSDTAPPPPDVWDLVISPSTGSYFEVRYGTAVGFVTTSPLRLAYGYPTFWEPEMSTPEGGGIHIVVADIETQETEVEAAGKGNLHRTSSIAVADFSGDGVLDVAFNYGVLDGPFELPYTFDRDARAEWAGTRVAACDANGDGQPDLCGSQGLDLGPVDGVPESTWGPGSGLPDEHIAIVALGGTDTVITAAPLFGDTDRLARFPLDVLGPIDVADVESWFYPNVFVLDALASHDPDGDGTDELLMCGTQAGQTTLWRFDAFPSAPMPLLRLNAPCRALELADFDGDGVNELAIGLAARIDIVELDGSLLATHVGRVLPGRDDLGASLDSADVNGDGRADLLAGAPNSGAGAVYLTLSAVP